MYYVNQEQIDFRLAFVPTLTRACAGLQAEWSEIEIQGRAGAMGEDKREQGLLLHLAQERVLYLAIETVTDVGSLLIDAFMMRDASSYEDIIDILAGEGVFERQTAETLRELVQLRRALTQEYAELPRAAEHPLIAELSGALTAFAEAVPAFISKERL